MTSTRTPLRVLTPLEWAAVEAVTNGLRVARRGVASAQAELAAIGRRRAGVLAALDLDADREYAFEADGEGGATVYARETIVLEEGE